MTVPIERCVLRCLTQEGYTSILAKPVGAFSLVEALLEHHHDSLAVGQTLPETAAYPCMLVVDVTPLTCAALTDAATCVVLPPPAPTSGDDDDRGGFFEQKNEDTREMGIDSDVIAVQLHTSLQDGECLADSRTAREALFFAGDEGLFTVAGDASSSTFRVSVVKECAEGTAVGGPSLTSRQACTPFRLLVGPALFRNLRRVVCHTGCAQRLVAEGTDPGTGPVPLHFGHDTMVLPFETFALVEDNAGNPLALSVSEMASLSLKSLQLAPAMDDFFLTNVVGEGYFDTLSTLVAMAAPQLDGKVVSLGDVLFVRLNAADMANLASHSREAAIDGVDALEALYAHLQHGVERWDAVWSSSSVASANTNSLELPLRVVGLTGGRAAGPAFGFVNVSAGNTAVSLVSPASDSSTVLDATPLYAPMSSPRALKASGSAFPALETLGILVDTLAPILRPSSAATSSALHVLVVHGIKENWPHEIVERAVAQFGLRNLCVSVDALEAAELETVLERFLSGDCSHHAALVVKNAQNLLPEKRHMLGHLDGRASAGGGALPRLPRVIFLICESLEAVPPSIAARATNVEGVIECGNPSEADRQVLLEWLVCRALSRSDLHRSLLLSTSALAAWTVGLPLSEIAAYAEECFSSALQLLSGDGTGAPAGPETGAQAARAVLSDTLCEETLQRFLKSHGHNLVSTKLQPVRWSDVGGLEDAKRELRETIQLPMLHPELFANGMKKRTGILFYGPPGCGKTLLAKAVATEMNMNFMSVKGPELINQYVGESEKNIRLLFQKARDNSPCIVFFDELDALVPARGAKGDAGGAMDRIVSQLLVEVDGVGQKRSDGTASGDVFIIGATNRPDLLDPSLLRPGRFDRLCYLGMPSTKEEQLYAVKALTRKFQLNEDVDLMEVLAPLDLVYTGADFFALCSDAMMFAVEERLESVRAQMEAALGATADRSDPERGDEKSGDHSAVDEADPSADTEEEAHEPIQVSMVHFLRARAQLKPSVTKEDLLRYEALKSKFSNS